MSYNDLYSETISKKFKKIKKKDSKHLEIIFKKIDDILQNPNNKYKFLHHELKGLNRVHIGHFVLVFKINHQTQTISFEDYDHHDKIYQ
jgi:mRNA-degrading endonuclease RelE of RelBE toxin-antitoxin system